MPHVPQHYPPPLQHQYYPPHFIHTGQPSYQQYLPMRPVRTQPEVLAPEYPPTQELSQASSKAPASSQVSARLRSNPEPRPGVFSFDIDVVAGDMKRGFRGETDMPWDDFKSRVLAYLNAPEEVQLVYKFAGDNSKASHLNNAEAFGIAMDQLCHKVSNARTRVVALEVKNAAAKQTTTKAKKRTREDDIPPAIEEDSTQLKAYKQLECHIRCELHRGHCFIDRTSGYDDHHRLDHAEMTLWAKKIIPTSKTPSPPPLPQQCHFESATQIHNTTLPDYPKIGVLLALIDVEKPELRIRELETSLLDAGVVLSSQVMLLPEDVLSVIGDMGQKQARILRNYAKQIVLPLLGLVNSYEEPEAPSAGTQNKGKERAIETEYDLWQEGESEYGSSEYDEYESDDETEGGGEFLT
ncbi:hypothetical protein EV424DRAFT_1327815 [Suillus variegatus]|nr:hypothetical protein EV424DRAFT_1327815 [Suillus variegatus]